MRRTCMIALAMYSCLAGQTAPAQESGYSDDEVKLQFVEAGMFCHAEFIKRGCQRAFEMAGFDTNRYARILRELAVENTNETKRVIANLGKYKTSQSLPSRTPTRRNGRLQALGNTRPPRAFRSCIPTPRMQFMEHGP